MNTDDKVRVAFTLNGLEFAGLCGIASSRRVSANEAAKMIVQARVSEGRKNAEVAAGDRSVFDLLTDAA